MVSCSDRDVDPTGMLMTTWIVAITDCDSLVADAGLG